MKLLFLPPTLSHPNPLLRTFRISCFYKPPKSLSSPMVTSTAIPPRDRVISFGKHKGKMLGTLSSSYLKWISKNLRAREFEEWAILADQVLTDPVYKDRIEWEFAERLLTGNGASFSRSGEGAAAELAELSVRFGWDYEDDAAWRKVNFGLLGTSQGGRIPRISPNRTTTGVRKAAPVKREKARVSESEGSGREKRRERLRSKRSERPTEGKTRMVLSGINGVDDSDGKIDQNWTAEIPKRFPGRESLLKKVIDHKQNSVK